LSSYNSVVPFGTQYCFIIHTHHWFQNKTKELDDDSKHPTESLFYGYAQLPVGDVYRHE